MQLTSTEKFFVLIQHPEKSCFIVSEQIRQAGLIGSIMLDLAHNGNLEIVDGMLMVKSLETNLSSTHKKLLNQVEESARTRKVKSWISRFSRRFRTYQKEIVIGLESKGIVSIQHKRFLGIKYYRSHLENTYLREELIADIHDIIFQMKPTNNESAIILGIIHACHMHKIFCNDKSEVKMCKRKLKEIMKSDQIAQGVDKAIKEMQAAVLGAIVASSVVVNASAHSS